MRRFTGSTLLLLGLAVGSWSCSNTVPSPVNPDNPTITENFSGTLTPNGAQTFSFNTAGAGAVTATLTTVSPDSTVAIGLAIGTLVGTQCTVTIANDRAVQGDRVVGTVSGAGSLCARVYDVGNLTASESVTITVVHP